MMHVETANRANVERLLEDLRQAYERVINESPEPLKYMDAFMAIHNLHKLVIMDMAAKQELTPEQRAFFYHMAVDTFAQGMVGALERK